VLSRATARPNRDRSVRWWSTRWCKNLGWFGWRNELLEVKDLSPPERV
jgi:hypothetical protein